MNIKDLKINNEIFKTKRVEKSLSMRKVEDLSGVNRSTISNIENGNYVPDGNNLLRLMFFYDLSKEQIALSK